MLTDMAAMISRECAFLPSFPSPRRSSLLPLQSDWASSNAVESKKELKATLSASSSTTLSSCPPNRETSAKPSPTLAVLPSLLPLWPRPSLS